MKKKKHKKIIIIVSSSIEGLLVSVAAAFFIYVSIYNHATENALKYLNDTETVKVVDNDSYLSFAPKKSDKNVGFVFLSRR